MKKIYFKIGAFVCLSTLLTACGDFDEINKNPTAADIDQVQIEYFINSYMFQKPHLGTIHDDEE